MLVLNVFTFSAVIRVSWPLSSFEDIVCVGLAFHPTNEAELRPAVLQEGGGGGGVL